MVDPLRLRALLERLGDEVADLRRLARYDADTLLADRVHGYADIDDRRVVATLHNHLEDFDRFRRALAASAAGPSDDDTET